MLKFCHFVGTYCCIIGKAVKTKGLPEVQATKIIDLSSQPQMKDAWESEVKEAELVLQGKLLPAINWLLKKLDLNAYKRRFWI